METKDFRPISDNVWKKLDKEYFLKKLEQPSKESRKKVADMSGTALKILLAAHRIWSLHYRHEPIAVHFYWKYAKAGNQYLGDRKVADIIFFDGEEERNCFFVEIMVLWETIEGIARARWCALWFDEKLSRYKDSVIGETYIRI